jgi:hypothetical protein
MLGDRWRDEESMYVAIGLTPELMDPVAKLHIISATSRDEESM